ncbi:MAG: SDR family NAD(P)-dependent oxidoreductase [Desulfomonilaceae bacterium]|nr:SDR family NAD(P)-dependent oxidoreductase [Desulfomonilaceae bacterium]
MLNGHTALVTGAAQGIGRAAAEELSAQGADLVLVDRNERKVQETADSLKEKGGSVRTLALDLTDLDLVGERIGRLADEMLIDILVNNAGFDRPGTTRRIDTEDLDAVLTIHVKAPFLLIKLLLPAMRTAGWGRIINVSSIYGLTGAKGEVAYSTAKAAVIGLTKAVAKEAGDAGVTVNAVMPGLTLTPTIERFMADKYKQQIVDVTPLARAGEPQEIAKVIAFLASHDASFITAAAIPVSGGWAA